MSRWRNMLAEATREIGGRKREFVWLSMLVVVYSFTYSMTRPPTESLFLEEYGHERLPEAWLVVTVTMLLAVEIYSRLVVRVGALRMFAGSALVSGVLLALLMTLQAVGVDGVTYALYIWKEVYIILLVEAFWTVANVIFPIRTARWIYGFYCAAGAIGGVLGNLAAGLLAEWPGSQQSLWLVIPMLALAAGLALGFARRLPNDTTDATTVPRLGPGLWGVPRMLRASSYLTWMLVLVAVTQVVITLIDYEYNGAVRAAYPELDTRTQIISTVYGTINASSFFFQIATGPALRLIGVGGTLFVVPALLGTTVGLYLVWPLFGVMAVVKIASKALDYSLFRAAKEILYIPLSLREKTEGKALIDMLVYRSTKGGSYPLFRGIAAGGLFSVPQITFAFIGVWLGVTAVIARRYRQRVDDGDHQLDRRSEVVTNVPGEVDRIDVDGG